MTHDEANFAPAPPADGKLHLKSGKVQGVLNKLYITKPSLILNGAMVFDIDETLMSPDASLSQEPEVLRLLSALLKTGIKVGLISGGPGTVVSNRIISPLRKNLSEDAAVLKNMLIYANGGSSKLIGGETGSFIEDAAYASLHRIPGEHLECVRQWIEKGAESYFGLDPSLCAAVLEAWKRKRQSQWKGLSVSFDDSWMEKRAWKVQLWDDQAMARAKTGEEPGHTSFPFINVRRVEYGPDGRLSDLAGMSISGFYALRRESGDPVDLDLRDRLIRELKDCFEVSQAELVMRKAGRSSIDVTKKGTDKAAALKDSLRQWGIHAENVYYFGDEFFEGGNDFPAAEDAEISEKVTFVALNKHLEPPLDHICWAGRSYAATRQLLSLFLDHVAE